MKKIMLLLLLSCSILLSGCRTTHYVPIEYVQHERVIGSDTVFVQDSLYEFITYRNDTVFQFKDRYHTIYEHKIDTIMRVDSIPVIKEIEKIVEVERPVRWYEKFLMWSGVIFVLILIKKIYKMIKM